VVCDLNFIVTGEGLLMDSEKW